MIHIKHLISELERLTRLDDSLRDARAFILTLVAGVEHSLEHGQPLVAALWLQDKLKSESEEGDMVCLLYTSPSPRDQRGSRMPSSA